MIENITQAGCIGGKIDIRKRHGPHRNFLKLYNQTYELQAKGKLSRIITSVANNGLLIVIFLVLCSQALGVEATKVGTPNIT